MSARVDVGDDFETHRSSVESVSVLFKLFGREGDDLVAVPSGWSVTGARFEVCWPDDPEKASLVRSHFGARRFAYNWALDQVKSDMDARSKDPDHQSIPWSLQGLRKRWNQANPLCQPIVSQIEPPIH